MASLDRFPLHYLAAFRAAAQTENLRAAADSLHLTHSAVSQQIRALETQLGFALFERQGRRIVLNAAGHTLRAGVERAYGELEQALQAFQLEDKRLHPYDSKFDWVQAGKETFTAPEQRGQHRARRGAGRASTDRTEARRAPPNRLQRPMPIFHSRDATTKVCVPTGP